jgi:hypothetical protein
MTVLGEIIKMNKYWKWGGNKRYRLNNNGNIDFQIAAAIRRDDKDYLKYYIQKKLSQKKR